MKKEWFLALRNPVPADMELYLEEQAQDGYFLQPLGEKGLFYFEFEERKSGKCKYMVDVTKLPKAMYMHTLISKGWEYMGTSGNCYVWKQPYEDKRPNDMSDRLCKLNYCKTGAIIMLILALATLALSIALGYSYYYEIKNGLNVRHYIYIAEVLIDLPISLFFFITYRKFSRGISIYK